MKGLKMTPATQVEKRSISEDLRQLLKETGFDLTGMDPSDIRDLVDSFREVVSSTRHVLRGEEEVA